METLLQLPRLYVILDRATLDARGLALVEIARELQDAGVTLFQYRDKTGAPQDVLRAAQEIAAALGGANAVLIMNDRADLAARLGWGVHVGQSDLAADDAKGIAGSSPVGLSTHTDQQVNLANASVADYVAVGPVFATGTKLDAGPVVGLEGVRRARRLTHKPLVAIGGITRENARSVIDAGADSVAVISGLFVPGESPGKVARDFLALLR